MTEEKNKKNTKLSQSEREKKLIRIVDLYAKSNECEKSYLDGVIATMSALIDNFKTTPS